MSIFLVIAGCVVYCFVITLTATYIIDPLILYIENGLLASWIKNVWFHFKKQAWKYRYILIFSTGFSTGVPILSYFIYGCSSKMLLLSGGIFQAIGTLSAACSTYATIMEWIQSFPRIKQKVRPCQPCLAIQESCGIACHRLYIFEDNKNSSIDERLSNLDLNQKAIKEIVDYLCKREDGYRFLKEKIDEEIKNKTYEVEINIKSQLEKLHLSDFFPTIIGLLWIAIGVILATIGSL